MGIQYPNWAAIFVAQHTISTNYYAEGPRAKTQ
jgi:hypothetical protein